MFAGEKGGSVWDESAVYQMAPRGSYALLRTTYTEDKKKGIEASLKAQFGASLGVKVPYELKKSTEIKDKVRITRQPHLDFSNGPDRDPNQLNAVE